MRRVTSTRLVAIAALSTAMLIGCGHSPLRPDETARATAADCPDALREQLRIAASATPTLLPDQPEGLLARRLLISAAPAHGAAGTKVNWSTLTVTIVGGTFAGDIQTPDSRSRMRIHPSPWEVAHNRALEVIPGRVRVQPFLSSSKLRAETVALDVTVVPGGIPADKITASFPHLWTPDGHPVAPETVEIAVSAERHPTVFDVVEAHVSLDVEGTGPPRSGDVWRCTYETRLTLVDHDSLLPPLWDLHIASRDGKPKRWLALFEPAVGPFRAIFTDAQTAQAFATWLHSTGATQVGQYQLGLFEADKGRTPATIPADQDIGSSFQLASPVDMRILTAGRLGEN
jgi:hypothetical protein